MRAARWAEGPMNRTELLKNEIVIPPGNAGVRATETGGGLYRRE